MVDLPSRNKFFKKLDRTLSAGLREQHVTRCIAAVNSKFQLLNLRFYEAHAEWNISIPNLKFKIRKF